MSRFRLVAYGWGGRGPLTLSPVYDTVEVAERVAERIIDKLARQPHKRPYRIDIVDVWTRETVTRVHADTAANPDPFTVGDSESGPPGPIPSQMRVAPPGPGGP